MKVRIIHANQHTTFISAVRLKETSTSEMVPVLLMAFQLTVHNLPVTSLTVNGSITVLTFPFILLMWIPLGLFQRLLLSHLSHWLEFRVFPYVNHTLLQYLHLDMLVCFHHLIDHLWSNFYSHFPQLLALSTIKYIPAFNNLLPSKWCIMLFLPSMRDIFNWGAGLCSNSSSWLALYDIPLYFFKHPSALQVDPQLYSATLWPFSLQQNYNFWIYTVSHLCCLFIFLNMSLCFFSQILRYSKAVFVWYVLQPDILFVSWNP